MAARRMVDAIRAIKGYGPLYGTDPHDTRSWIAGPAQGYYEMRSASPHKKNKQGA